MRKYNSSIRTAFISEAGNQLRNNDYFGFVELDKFACYVIADGITGMGGAESAKSAISAAVDAFQREPGISRRKLKRYLRCANRELLQGKSYEKLKASVTVVVSDYVKFRYGQAGNTRLRLYRDGRCVQASRDMSLSQELADDGRLLQDRVARHEERNNLTAWLGSGHFRPFISKKKKLCAGDIITLYTRGIWENVDEGELADVFAEAGNEPMEECDKVEELLLSRQPADLDNYTFAAVYIEKVFTDPNRKKRIKKVIAVSVTAAVIAAVAALVIWLWHRDRIQKRADMEQYAANAAQYTDAGNFPRAKEEYGKALEQARKLRDAEAVDRYTAHLMAAEAVISADDLYSGADYAGAKEAYIRAAEQARQADNAGLSYIDGKLQQIGEYEQVFDSMELGDILFEQDNYGQAEEKYLEAKAKAAAIYYSEGKQQALDALDRLYEEWSAVKEEEEQQKKEREQENEEQAAELAADQAAAAELVRQGEEAFSEGDYDGANVFYLIAVEKYAALEDSAQIEFLNMKIAALKEKQAETAARAEDAKALEDLARQLEELNDYTQAKIHYQYAKAAYLEIGKNNKADEIQGKIDLIDAKEAQAEKERQQEKEEQEAKEKAEAEEKEEREKKEQAEKEEREKAEKEKEEKEKEENNGYGACGAGA